MSVRNMHLRKLLQIFFAPNNKRKSLLREDIRQEIGKGRGQNSSGGDFHVPFWTDAKNHAAGTADLREQTAVRVESNKQRKRLYPLLTKGFLTWWEEKRRWRNEPFKVMDQSVKARMPLSEIDAIVKVENILSLEMGEQSHRLIYPYFAEEPSLSPDAARLGLWLLAEALSDYPAEDFRILDVLRGTSFGIFDYPFAGNERDFFLRNYEVALQEWDKLRSEYD